MRTSSQMKIPPSFVDVANEADTSYRASKASKVDNTLDGRCAVQPSVGSPLLINIVASRIPGSFFDMGRPGQSFSVQLYQTLRSAVFAKKYIPDIYTSLPFVTRFGNIFQNVFRYYPPTTEIFLWTKPCSQQTPGQLVIAYLNNTGITMFLYSTPFSPGCSQLRRL